MRSRSVWYEMNQFLDQHLSPVVKWLILINTAVIVISTILLPLAGMRVLATFMHLFGQQPYLSIGHGMIWQFVTYMFIHLGPFHFLVNMIVLWFFGPRLEYRWGSHGFLKFYFIVGIGAGVFHALVSLAIGQAHYQIFGASGALYGVLLAYALYWPDDVVLVWGVFPVKVKVLVAVFFLMTFLGSFSPMAYGNISHLTHLGGLVVAFFYLKGGDIFRRRRFVRFSQRSRFDDLSRKS
jgi:membrane associated rhomboid family serine protease